MHLLILCSARMYINLTLHVNLGTYGGHWLHPLVLQSGTMSTLHVRGAQMGGPEGVRAAERTSITLSCANGMKVHALPRAHRA